MQLQSWYRRWLEIIRVGLSQISRIWQYPKQTSLLFLPHDLCLFWSISHFINIFPNMHHHVQELTYSIQESTFLNYHHGCWPLTIGINQCKFAIVHKGCYDFIPYLLYLDTPHFSYPNPWRHTDTIMTSPLPMTSFLHLWHHPDIISYLWLHFTPLRRHH